MGIRPEATRILVCEDSDTIARLWAAVLEQSGYQVVGPVSSAERALEEAYQHLPDLAMIDIGLSGSIDGISVAAELAPLGVPVILLTGNYQRASTEGRQVAADILIKPVLPSVLIGSVNSILRQKAMVGLPDRPGSSRTLPGTSI
jgi:DNA-binding response OmpR family regulator